jgi:hypothetical protein
LASLPVSLYDAREAREMAGGDAALAARGILALFFPQLRLTPPDRDEIVAPRNRLCE